MHDVIKQDICEIGRLLYARGYVVSNDGNISARVSETEIWMTPSGVGKGRMSPEMLVCIDLEGRVLHGERHPSSESKMHLEVYRQRLDVKAVVHAHPPTATAFSICRRPLSERYLAELLIGLGEVPVADYARLSTDAVPQSIAPYVCDHEALLLANHGALAWGDSLLAAFDRLEVVEHTAKIYQIVTQLGGGVALGEEEARALQALRSHYVTLAQPHRRKED